MSEVVSVRSVFKKLFFKGYLFLANLLIFFPQSKECLLASFLFEEELTHRPLDRQLVSPGAFMTRVLVPEPASQLCPDGLGWLAPLPGLLGLR